MNKLNQCMQMSNKRVALFLFLMINIVSFTVEAQPAGNRAVDDTIVEALDGCTKVTVFFVFPVQFLSNFPEESGKELRVQFRPLAVASSDALAAVFNESIRLVDDTGISISRFEYVGRSATDPYLWLVSPDTFYFKARQGEDFRSIVMYLSPNPMTSCE